MPFPDSANAFITFPSADLSETEAEGEGQGEGKGEDGDEGGSERWKGVGRGIWSWRENLRARAEIEMGLVG